MTADMVATAPCGLRTLVEADGPSRFLRVLAAPGSVGPRTGTSLMHSRLLRKGFPGRILAIPYYEWDALSGAGAREAYLRQRLQ